MRQAESPTKALLNRCAAGELSACEEAYASLQDLFEKIARRIALEFHAPSEANELVQEIFLKLTACQKSLPASLPDGEAEARAYLACLAANASRDWFRVRGAAKRGYAATTTLDDSSRNIEKALGRNASLDREVLIREIEELLPSSQRERTIFRLFYRQGFSASEIAQIPAIQLSTKGVESVLTRLSKSIREKLQQAKGKSSAGTYS